MNDREIILGMIEEYFEEKLERRMPLTAEHFAYYLIANGVTVQKHGRWEFVDDYTGRCTNCKEENLMDWELEDKFCPNCGAKMDLEG